ncbi:MAG: cytochrome C assembly family protein [Porticoccaceae bacterium]
MTTFIFGSSAIALYLLGWVAYVLELSNKVRIKVPLIQALTGLTIIFHGFATFGLLFQGGGLDLSLLKILALLALIINSLVYLNGLREPINSLYLVLFPISAITLILAILSTSTKSATILPYNLQAHILTSILAYSFLAIAALHALLAGYQNWQLKHKHQNALMRTLPPLETMEKILFELIWVGEILLTVSLLTGFYVYNDFFAQQLIHKVTFSIVAWLVYAVLIFGKFHYGWRGQRAINWTWVGFSGILLGYIGSKFVIEFILT